MINLNYALKRAIVVIHADLDHVDKDQEALAVPAVIVVDIAPSKTVAIIAVDRATITMMTTVVDRGFAVGNGLKNTD